MQAISSSEDFRLFIGPSVRTWGPGSVTLPQFGPVVVFRRDVTVTDSESDEKRRAANTEEPNESLYGGVHPL